MAKRKNAQKHNDGGGMILLLVALAVLATGGMAAAEGNKALDNATQSQAEYE